MYTTQTYSRVTAPNQNKKPRMLEFTHSKIFDIIPLFDSKNELKQKSERNIKSCHAIDIFAPKSHLHSRLFSCFALCKT